MARANRAAAAPKKKTTRAVRRGSNMMPLMPMKGITWHKAQWYTHYEVESKEWLSTVKTYIKKHYDKKLVSAINKLPDWKIGGKSHWACAAYLLDNQPEIVPEAYSTGLNRWINELAEEGAAVVEEKKAEEKSSTVKKPNIQDHLREKARECANDLEEIYDEFIYTDNCKFVKDRTAPMTILHDKNPSPQLINSIIVSEWKKQLDEFKETLNGTDPQLVEGYRHFKKTDIKNIIKFIEQIIADCESYVQLKKVNRAPRRRVPVTPEKQARKYKILKEYPELGIESMPASKLVNGSEAWLYDVKKRKLIHLVADEYTKTFTVKNNSIIGYSTKETVQKTIRKPVEQIKDFMKQSKPGSRKAFSDIKTTEVAWNTRGTENLVILKVW